MADSTQAKLDSITPFFIVRDLSSSIAFYRDRLGFQLTLAIPEPDPFFAILRRDAVQIMVKVILPEVHPTPNRKQHPWATWDAFVHTDTPDPLAAEFESRGVTLHAPCADTDDQLRGFEIQDPDGYVLFFGHPR